MKHVVSLLSFLFSFSLGFSQNLISNGDFESNGQLNCSSWYDRCQQELTYLCDSIMPGNPCDVDFYKDAPETGGTWSIGVTGVGNSLPSTASTYITGQSGTNRYLLNVWMKDIGQGWGGVIIGTHSKGNYVQEKIIPADTLEWTFYSVEDTLQLDPADSIEITLWAFAAGPSFGTVYFDQVEFILLDNLSSVSDLDQVTSNYVSVYPNPSGQVITLDIHDQNKEHIISLYNTSGQLIKSIVTSEQKMTLDIHDLGSGLFFYCVDSLNERKRIGEGKFLVQ